MSLKRDGKESGNIAFILAVICAAALSTFVLNNDRQKTTMRSKEIKSNRVVSDAQQMNLTAISYLSSILEKDKAGFSPVEVQGKKIKGKGNNLLSISGGKAFFQNIQVSKLSGTTMQGAMTGVPPAPVAANSVTTELEIMDQTQDPTFDIYDVKATTSVAVLQKGAAMRAVKTMARIKVAIVPPCDGFVLNKFCYYYGADGASCDATCGAHSRDYDDAGTDYLSSSDAACGQTLDNFGAPGGPISATRVHIIPNPMGCKYYSGAWVPTGRYNLADANGSGAYPGGRRICACKIP